jgi:pimeloyl-ACP methyl ester carboxylesterase
MRRTRAHLAAAATAIAVALGCVGAVGISAPARAASAPLAWGTCPDLTLVQAGVECAMLTVPLDWDHPAGEQIQIALSRARATHDRQGVLLTDPGGPGGSGLGLPAVLPSNVPHDVGRSYDWIGFDPRGVGASRPALSCEGDYLNGPRPAYKPAQPKSQAPNEKAWIDRTVAYTKDCAAKNGQLLSHVRTIDTVRDMDAIRAALGESKLNYYGFSYGTFLGQAYATKYPTHLRRMVLDGNVPPDYPGYGDGRRAQMTALQFVLDKFLGWIAEHESTYHLGTDLAAVTAAYDKVETDLTKTPVGEIGSAEWDDVFLVAAYAESQWPALASALSDGVAGDISSVRALYNATDHPGDDNSFAAFNATYCTDGPFPTDYAKVRADAFSIASAAPLAAWGGFWFSAPCTWWPVAASAPLHIDGAQSALRNTPILLVNGTRDGATPFAGALAVRREFPSSALVAEVDSTTHAGSLQGNPCVDDKIADYLATGKLPARLSGDRADASCQRRPYPKPPSLIGAGAS